jgi:2-methylcitrate dehydratase PrpD
VSNAHIGIATLADWLAGSPAVPEEARRRAALILADTVGCAVGAAGFDPSRVVRTSLERFAGPGPCTIFGSQRRGDPVTAATVNAFTADVLDYEDSLLAHPSVAAVPAALAVAEFIDASGAELLDAIVRGYEAGVRVGLATASGRDNGRIHPSQWAWQGFTAAVSAGSLLRLSATEFVSAMGVVAASTPVPVDMFRTGRPLPWSKTSFADQTRVGVTAAFLASNGFHSTAESVDGPSGYAFSSGAGSFDRRLLAADLGTEWKITEATIKAYPSCRMTHTSYQAAVTARRELGNPESIAGIVVHGFDELAELMEHDPRSVIDATFSLPYVVSVALLGTPPGPQWYSEETWQNPERKRLARSIRFAPDAQAQQAFVATNAYPARVTIETADGRTIEASESHADVLVTEGNVRQKFLTQTSAAMGQSGDVLWNALSRIGSTTDVREALAGFRVGHR